MAFKDIRSSVADVVSPQPVPDATEQKIQKIFSELSREFGLSDAEFINPMEQPEEFKLVYDKFSGRTR